MKKIFSLVLAMSFVVGLGAQTPSQYEELLKVKNKMFMMNFQLKKFG